MDEGGRRFYRKGWLATRDPTRRIYALIGYGGSNPGESHPQPWKSIFYFFSLCPRDRTKDRGGNMEAGGNRAGKPAIHMAHRG